MEIPPPGRAQWRQVLARRRRDRIEDTAVCSLRTTGQAGASGGFERGDDLPSTIGRYRVLMPLGTGATGVVVSAFDPDLDRKLALKLLHGDHENEVTRRRLFREAQALARVNHPHVVEVYHVGSDAGRVFIATEFIDGVSLWKWLRQRTRTPDEIIEAFVAAGRGLAAAHRAGIVHRDFKPANALIDRKGRVVVIDFGIANAVGAAHRDPIASSTAPVDSSTALQHTVGLSGTPSYMAPEQFARQPADARTDQFSFCVAMWEALFGTRPHLGDTSESISRAVLAGDRRHPPPDHDVPGAVVRILDRGLATNPADRYPSMEPLLDALERIHRRPRRGRWYALAGLAAVLAGAGWSSLGAHSDDARCQGERAELADAWSEEVRARFEPGRAGRPDPTEAGRRLVETLDAYAQEWESVHRRTCGATEAASWGETHLIAQCLEERRTAFIELVALLDQPDGPPATRGLDAALALPSVAACQEAPAPTGLASPAEPVRSDAFRRIRRLVQRARSRRALGDFEGALSLVNEGLAPAATMESPRPRAVLHVERGQALMGLNQSDDAIESLEIGHRLAMDAGDDATAAHAAVQLMALHADRPGGLERSLKWGRLAEALLARIEDGNRLFLHYNYGLAYWRGGEIDRALAHLQKAQDEYRPGYHNLGHQSEILQLTGILLARKGEKRQAATQLEAALRLEEDLYGPLHPSTATIHNNLAAILLEDDQLEGAEEHLRLAVESWDAAGGGYVALAGAAWNNLGVVQGRRENYEEAMRSYERSIERILRVDPDDTSNVARPQANIADILEMSGELQLSEQLRRSVLDRLQDAHGPLDDDTLTTRQALGEVLVKQGRIDEGTRLLADVAQMRRKIANDDDPENLARALLAWGRALSIAGEHRRAIEVVENARDVLGSLDHARRSRAKIAVALAAIHVRAGHADLGRDLARGAQPQLDGLPWDEAAEYGHGLASALRDFGDPRGASTVAQSILARLPDTEVADHWRAELSAFALDR